ncbi:hypothetical protein E4U61_004069 [Claviceps capensis]|nr:hypothetical protein E4U61_004069 [Claviceps capensis]
MLFAVFLLPLGIASAQQRAENPSRQNRTGQFGHPVFQALRKAGLERLHSPFVRASGSDEVVNSAQAFVCGFFMGKRKDARQHRLNMKLPGAKLTLEETTQMMDLCPLTTAASTKRELNSFCRLFSRAEWLAYNYHQTLTHWYAYGPGNPMASTQEPVQGNTSTDPNLDNDSDTFPLDRSMYADFAYDSTLMTVYGALGLWTNETVVLPSNHMVSAIKADGYSATWLVPFRARMYVEKMDCDKDGKDLVRVLVNDRVVVPKGCKADALGRCKLQDFVDGLRFARKGGHWDQC